MSVNPLSESGIFFCRPAPFERCAVLALTIQFKVKGVLQVSKFGLTDRGCGQRCGNKDNPILLGHDQVSRQHYGSPDTDRNVDASQLHLRPCRWIVAPIESVEISDSPVFFRISYTGVEYESRMGVGGDTASKIGPD